MKFTGRVCAILPCGPLGDLEMHIEYERDGELGDTVTKTTIPGITLEPGIQEVLESNLETSPEVQGRISLDVDRRNRLTKAYTTKWDGTPL
ncbi:MAG: hypothetical protein IPO00_09740 [Betaproteobacteria bacterium]|nr:hypothetical protein [Betaproteobacteria bacterium]